jgi:hypothetical protein
VASEILQLRKVEQVARYRKLQNIIKKKIKHKIKKKLYLRFKYRNGRITCLNKDPIHFYIYIYIYIMVVNSVLFYPEWPKHSIPIQKIKQNGTIFISF